MKQNTKSDMHWFDAADEASHEDSLRALAKGGFDEVLNAIGTYLGLDHLVTFSIGLLAVTKADKGVSPILLERREIARLCISHFILLYMSSRVISLNIISF